MSADSAGFEVISASGLDEISEFESQWRQVAAEAAWPLCDWPWMAAACRRLHAADRKLFILIVNGRELLAGIALAQPPGRNLMQPVGFVALHEAGPILSRAETATTMLVDALVSCRRPLALRRVIGGERLDGSLVSVARGEGWLVRVRASGVPFLDLNLEPGASAPGLSSNLRSTLRRKRRRLEKRGDTRILATYPDADRIGADLDEFETLEAAGWKGRYGSSIRQRPGFHAFFLDALTTFASEGRVRIDRLIHKGATIAIQFGLVYAGRYFLLKPTFDERFGEYSPGYLLTYEAIEQSIAEGLRSHEFLGGEDDWKLRFTSTIHETKSWIYYPRTLVGAGQLVRDVSGALAAKWSRRTKRRLAK